MINHLPSRHYNLAWDHTASRKYALVLWYADFRTEGCDDPRTLEAFPYKQEVVLLTAFSWLPAFQRGVRYFISGPTCASIMAAQPALSLQAYMCLGLW